MKYLQLILSIAFLATACCTQNNIADSSKKENNDPHQDAFVKYFKVQSFCSCYKYSFKDTDIIDIMSKEDLMGSYDELANRLILKKIDSLGETVSKTILPSTYQDFENKRRITSECLRFYTSEKLDSIAYAEYIKYNK